MEKHLKWCIYFLLMSLHTTSTQNNLLLSNLMDYYNNTNQLTKMMKIINGESRISLRIVDWFVTNYAKKYFVVYEQTYENSEETYRFKVHNDYKLKLKAYSKKRFDPFCRRERITIPFDERHSMETTLGQLNFFKWAIQNKVIDYIESHYEEIEEDMTERNSSAKKEKSPVNHSNKTRKKREELSVSACKCIKKEDVNIIVKFN